MIDAEFIERESQGHGTAKFHLPQLAFVLSKAKVTVAQAGIRGGKTHGGAFKSLMYSLKNPTAEDEFHVVASPTYPMSKVPVEKLFRLLYDKTLFPINPLLKYHKADRVFELQAINRKRTRIKVLSMHDPDKARGIKALSAWADEGAYMERYAWEVLQGRLADTDGPAWITTTPAGYNWVYELYEEALAEKRAGVPVSERVVRFIHWSSFANTFIPKSGFERLQMSYDSRTAEQEIGGLFVKMSGLVYQFSARNVMKGALNRNKPVYVGQDFNVAKMCSAFVQELTPTTLHIIHERIAPDSDTYGLARYLDNWCAQNAFPKSKVVVIPDASGAARSTSGKSDTRILKDAGYSVRYAKKNPFVKDRVNCVNGLLAPHGAMPRLYVDPSCTETIRCFEKQKWDTEKDPPIPDKSEGFDHQMDATGYVCWALHPLRVSATTGQRKAA